MRDMGNVSEVNERPAWMMIRAEITDDDWKQLRMLALREGVTVQSLVGGLLRDRLEQEAAK